MSAERVQTASGTVSGGSTPGPNEEELEKARGAARVAQKEFEEKQRRKAELERKKEELERQRVELLERQRVEKERLAERIRRAQEKKAKAVEKIVRLTAVEANGNGEHEQADGEEDGRDVEQSNGVEDANGENSRTEQLQKMLADLQSQVYPRSVKGMRC